MYAFQSAANSRVAGKLWFRCLDKCNVFSYVSQEEEGEESSQRRKPGSGQMKWFWPDEADDAVLSDVRAVLNDVVFYLGGMMGRHKMLIHLRMQRVDKLAIDKQEFLLET